MIELQSRKSELEAAIAEIEALECPDKIRAYLCKFLVILMCGYIERSIEVIILERLSSRAQKRVLNFVKSYFRRGQNLKCAAIFELLERFDVNWARSFRQTMDLSGNTAEKIDSLYGIRNSIAHGGSHSLGISALKSYKEDVVKLVEIVMEVTRR